MATNPDQPALDWQIGIWNRMSDVYSREIDRRFIPVIQNVIARANLKPGESVLDLGTGTGAAAELAATTVGPTGSVLAVDPSPEMLTLAQKRMNIASLTNVTLSEGRAEEIPAADSTFDAVLASLSLMFALDRQAAAHEIARVLKPNGCLVAAVWSAPDRSDFIRLQQIAGSFAPEPPVPGAGPGALGNPAPFLALLAEAGITAQTEEFEVTFEFKNLDEAWTTFAGVTAAQLSPELQDQAKSAILAELYPNGDGPRQYKNICILITGNRN
jgi:SAM-dependent methyltransferase